MAAKTIVWGENRPITIKLPNCYWDVIEAMTNLSGQEVEELATERLKQIISEDVIHDCDEGYFGKLLTQGWRDTLKDDPYYKSITGSDKK